MIAAPPLFVGGVKLTVTCALPLTPLTAVGAPGAVSGDTSLEALRELAPLMLDATSIKVYAVPLVSPVTVMGEAKPVTRLTLPPPTGRAITE